MIKIDERTIELLGFPPIYLQTWADPIPEHVEPENAAFTRPPIKYSWSKDLVGNWLRHEGENRVQVSAPFAHPADDNPKDK